MKHEGREEGEHATFLIFRFFMVNKSGCLVEGSSCEARQLCAIVSAEKHGCMNITGYIPVVCLVTMLPMGIGYVLGKLSARRAGDPRAPADARRSALSAGIGIIAWLCAAWIARQYAETDLPGWAAAEWFAHRGKWFVFSFPALFGLGFVSPTGASAADNRRACFVLPAIALVVFVAVSRTIPIYPFLSPSPARDDRGHIRQSVEFTCGPVALANLLELQSPSAAASEREIARLATTTLEGTTIGDLVRAAKSLGLEVVACRGLSTRELEAFQLPAIVSISTMPSVRHATLLLRFEGNAVYLLDPGYGLMVATRERLDEIRYGPPALLRGRERAGGKALILKRRSDETPSR